MYQWLSLVFILGWVMLPMTASPQAVEVSTVTSPSPWSAQSTVGNQSADIAGTVEHLVDHTNSFRQQEDRPPLPINPQLTATAQDFATFMARTGQFSHTADGQTPEARAKAQGYDACLIAENIAHQHSPTGFTAEALAEGFFQGWQQSPGHRENLLDPTVTETGVGVAQSEQTGAYYAVQLFALPRSEQIEFQITNTSNLSISYAIDGQMVSLPAQATQIHQQCRPPEVTFHWPGTQEQTMVHPSHRDHYTILQGDDGEFQVESG